MSVHLEAFEGNLKGRKVCVFGGTKEWLARLALLESEVLYKGRTVLVIQAPSRGASIPPQLFRRPWNAVYWVKENFDYQMILTYVANAPKPVRVCWWIADGFGEIPRSVWGKWAAGGAGEVSLLAFNSSLTRGDLWGVEWDCITFPLSVKEEFVSRVLANRGSGARAASVSVSSHLDEIRANGAALVWSNIGTSTGGYLYWYDPEEAETAVRTTLQSEEAVAMLEEIREFIQQSK